MASVVEIAGALRQLQADAIGAVAPAPREASYGRTAHTTGRSAGRRARDRRARPRERHLAAARSALGSGGGGLQRNLDEHFDAGDASGVGLLEQSCRAAGVKMLRSTT